MLRSILHLDLDAFFVSVERKKDSRLRGVPLIVGGTAQRGVVAACSYEARAFGVRSAMPVYQALALCPEARVVKGDMEAYRTHSRAVTDIIAARAPVFEKSSIDEFYIDASGMDRFFGTFKWACQLRADIIRETGLPISLALSVNKLVSKVATGEYKPNAEVEIAPGTEADFLAPLPIEKLPMVGTHTTEVLHRHGVRTVEQLRDLSAARLTGLFGKAGQSIWNKARALDDSPVVPYREQKSISTETTLGQDTADTDQLRTLLLAMVEKIAFQLREQAKLTSCVAVKIRYSNFDTETRQLAVPFTASDEKITRTAFDLFDALWQKGRPVRLIGVRLSELVHGHSQIHLFENTEAQVHLHEAMDWIKHKHGWEKLLRAKSLDAAKRVRSEGNLFKPD